ncbi:MAG: TIGR02594 family protein [Pseudomonadota bacterium]
MGSVLKLGSKGDEVKQLQKLLNEKLKITPKLSEDGDFGKRTDAAVKQFQIAKNLGVDGVVGPKTWEALTSVATAPKPSPQVVATDSAPWMEYAKREIDQTEIPGKKHNPKILAYHATTTLKASDDETPWCSSFVNWVLLQANVAGTSAARAISWMQWGKSCGPIGGAITVIYNAKAANSALSSSGNHVGFLVQETATHYVLLGGNQSDKVKVSFFPKSSWMLRGYRWPKE